MIFAHISSQVTPETRRERSLVKGTSRVPGRVGEKSGFFNILHGSEERHIEGRSYHSPNASSTEAGPWHAGIPVDFLTFLWRRDP